MDWSIACLEAMHGLIGRMVRASACHSVRVAVCS
uniref:Uncharacterized protein n=1 Tax=Arundo donax TaxID=35708 RepID=A0A0A9FN23_ARUDO